MPDDARLIADDYPDKGLDENARNIQEDEMNEIFDPPLDRVTPSMFQRDIPSPSGEAVERYARGVDSNEDEPIERN